MEAENKRPENLFFWWSVWDGLSVYSSLIPETRWYVLGIKI